MLDQARHEALPARGAKTTRWIPRIASWRRNWNALELRADHRGGARRRLEPAATSRGAADAHGETEPGLGAGSSRSLGPPTVRRPTRSAAAPRRAQIIATCEGDTIRRGIGKAAISTQVESSKIRSGRNRVRMDDDLVEIVRALARTNPTRGSSILNRQDRRTPHGQRWTASRVASLRNHRAIPAYRRGIKPAARCRSVKSLSSLASQPPRSFV